MKDNKKFCDTLKNIIDECTEPETLYIAYVLENQRVSKAMICWSHDADCGSYTSFIDVDLSFNDLTTIGNHYNISYIEY